MKKKKILYVASTFGHLSAFHEPYIRWYVEQGYEVHAAANGVCEVAGISESFKIPFEKRMGSPKNLIAIHELRKLICQQEYELISVHTSLAAFFARLAVLFSGKKPIVMNTVHGYLFDDRTSCAKRYILLAAERIAAGVTDYVLTMNLQDKRIAEKYGLGKKIIHTGGMGVDLHRFQLPTSQQRAGSRQALHLSEDAFVLVYAAEFSKRKNQGFLIEALKELPDCVQLLLPGRGDLLDCCKAQARLSGVERRVIFPGFVRDMSSCYHAADVCVSASRIEGLPFNIMEAMGCGLPVIATDIKGHEDLLRNTEVGFLYPFHDRNAFVTCVNDLMRLKTTVQLQKKTRDEVEPYNFPTVFAQLTAIYQEALHAR